jgi:hypothetical protein
MLNLVDNSEKWDAWNFLYGFARAALGYRGQLIFVVPVDNLVVVFTGSDPDNPPHVDHLLKNCSRAQ